MGKTLKRARAKAAREQAAAAAAEDEQRPGKQQRRQLLGGLTASSSAHKFASAVSAALASRDWLAAVALLEAMAHWGKVPRLGALMRWVRDADNAGSEPVTARLLEAMLRACEPPSPSPPSAGAPPATQQQQQQQQQQLPPLPPPSLDGRVVRHAPWAPPAPPLPPLSSDALPPPAPGDFAGRSRRLVLAPGEQDAGAGAAIHAYEPNVIRFEPRDEWPPEGAVRALPVPFVPGGVLLQHVLSPRECAQIVAAAQQLGFEEDPDFVARQRQRQQGGAGGGGGAAGGGGGGGRGRPSPPAAPATPTATAAAAGAAAAGEAGTTTTTAATTTAAAAAAAATSAARSLAAGLVGVPRGGPAAGCVWMADASLLGPIWERVRRHLPAALDGCRLAGDDGSGAVGAINPRLRIYRYGPAATYRPHVDGAWPCSRLDGKGRYVFDGYGDRWSRLTFLLYLNDGFEGGCTTYYTPAPLVITATQEKEQQGAEPCGSSSGRGVLEARSVVPRAGSVLIFPHGGARGSLVHEGAALTSGHKYVVRTDLMFLKPPPPQGAQHQKQRQPGGEDHRQG